MANGLGVGATHKAGTDDAVAESFHGLYPRLGWLSESLFRALPQSPTEHGHPSRVPMVPSPPPAGGRLGEGPSPAGGGSHWNHAFRRASRSKLSEEPVGRQPSTSLAWLVSRQRREFSEIASKISYLRVAGASRQRSIICTASDWER